MEKQGRSGRGEGKKKRKKGRRRGEKEEEEEEELNSYLSVNHSFSQFWRELSPYSGNYFLKDKLQEGGSHENYSE